MIDYRSLLVRYMGRVIQAEGFSFRPWTADEVDPELQPPPDGFTAEELEELRRIEAEAGR